MSQDEIYLPNIMRQIGLPVTNKIGEALLAFEGIKATVSPQELLALAESRSAQVVKAHEEFLNQTLADRITVGLAAIALGDLPGNNFSSDVVHLLQTPGVNTAHILAQTLLEAIATEDFVAYLSERED